MRISARATIAARSVPTAPRSRFRHPGGGDPFAGAGPFGGGFTGGAGPAGAPMPALAPVAAGGGGSGGGFGAGLDDIISEFLGRNRKNAGRGRSAGAKDQSRLP